MTNKQSNHKSLGLTHHHYKQLTQNPLAEIQYYFNTYNELSDPLLLNPINGQKVNVAKLLHPMRRVSFLTIGFSLLLISLLMDWFILQNLSTTSPFFSVITIIFAVSGSVILVPALIVYFLDQLKHSHAKEEARIFLNSLKKAYRPNLSHVTDELVIALLENDSPLRATLLQFFKNLKKDTSGEEILLLLNAIFTNMDANLSELVLDEMELETARKNLNEVLEEGLGYSETSFIEDPKFIQLIAYSIVIKLLTDQNYEGNFTSYFFDLNPRTLKEAYENFCHKFLNYCRSEYGEEQYMDEIEGRIMHHIIDFL